MPGAVRAHLDLRAQQRGRAFVLTLAEAGERRALGGTITICANGLTCNEGPGDRVPRVAARLKLKYKPADRGTTV